MITQEAEFELYHDIVQYLPAGPPDELDGEELEWWYDRAESLTESTARRKEQRKAGDRPSRDRFLEITGFINEAKTRKERHRERLSELLQSADIDDDTKTDEE